MPVSCWNIQDAIKNGKVTFSKADLSEGTKATVKCKEGKLVGASSLKCVGGRWNAPLPTCSIGGSILLELIIRSNNCENELMDQLISRNVQTRLWRPAI